MSHHEQGYHITHNIQNQVPYVTEATITITTKQSSENQPKYNLWETLASFNEMSVGLKNYKMI